MKSTYRPHLQIYNQLTLVAVYCPHHFTIAEDDFMQFFNSLGDYFKAAGDFNAKHTHWGSRLVTPKGTQLYNAIIKAKNKLDYVSSGRQPYWPADPMKLPDLTDFAITKNIPKNLISAECLSGLSSDHSPVLFILLRHPGTLEPSLELTSQKINYSTGNILAHTLSYVLISTMKFQHLKLQIHNATKRRQIYKSNSSFSKSDAYIESGDSTDRHLLGKA